MYKREIEHQGGAMGLNNIKFTQHRALTLKNNTEMKRIVKNKNKYKKLRS